MVVVIVSWVGVVSVQTSFVVMDLSLKVRVVVMVSDLPSADHVETDLLSPLPPIPAFTVSFPVKSYFVVVVTV